MNPDTDAMKKQTNKDKGLFLGADGCRNRWIAAVVDHGTLRLERYDSVSSLTETYPGFDSHAAHTPFIAKLRRGLVSILQDRRLASRQ